jgi:hypothetical protein
VSGALGEMNRGDFGRAYRWAPPGDGGGWATAIGVGGWATRGGGWGGGSCAGWVAGHLPKRGGSSPRTRTRRAGPRHGERGERGGQATVGPHARLRRQKKGGRKGLGGFLFSLFALIPHQNAHFTNSLNHKQKSMHDSA